MFGQLTARGGTLYLPRLSATCLRALNEASGRVAFVWIEGPRGLDARKLLDRALMHDRVAFVPGQAFFADGSGAETMGLRLSLVELAVIEEGVQRLARAIAAMQGLHSGRGQVGLQLIY